MYAGAAIYGKNLSHLSATVTAAGTMIWASIIVVPLSLIFDKPWTLNPSNQAILSVGVLAVFCTSLALLIYFRLLKSLGSSGVASQSYLRAGVGVMLGMIFLGEKISFVVSLGIVAAIIGVVAINYPVRKIKGTNGILY